MNINGIEILDITDTAYKLYINAVPESKLKSKDEVRIELTRNVLLGNCQGDRDGDKRYLYYYGDISIIVKDNEVVWVNSYHGEKQEKGKIDWQKKRELDNKLGLIVKKERTGVVTKGFKSLCIIR